MSVPLRLLLLEDNETDAALAVYYLERHGFDVAATRVDGAAAFSAALNAGPWDAVLADYALPGFSAPEALALLRASGPDLPFIILSGVIDEESAVTSLRAGAHDFVTKANHARLGPAMERELRAAQDRQARRAAEAAQRQQAAGYQMMFEDNPLPLLVYDPDSLRLLEVNAAAIAQYGYTRDEWLSMTLRDFRPAEDQDRLTENLRDVRGRQDRSGPWRHIKKNGDLIYVQIAANDTQFAGRPARLVLTLDVTKRVQAEAALWESEHKYRTLVETAEDVILMSDLEGRQLYRNPAFYTSQGLDPQAPPPDDIFDRIYPDDVPRLKAALGQILERGTLTYEYRLRHTAGHWMNRLARSTLLRDAAGQPAGIMTVIRDITVRQQALAALHESEDRYRDLVENSRDLICTHDLDGRILTVNPWAARSLGYAREAVEGRNLGDFLAPESAPELPRYLRAIQRRGAVQAVIRVRTAAGEERTWEFHSTLRTEGVAAPIVRGMAHDVTERMQAEAALRRERDLFARITDTSPAGIVLVDRQGQITFANPRAEQVLGLTRSAVDPRAYNAPEFRLTALDGGPFPEAELPFAQVRRTGLPVTDVRHAIEWPTGRRVLLSINAAPLLDAAGQVEGMVSTLEDITTRQAAELRIQRQFNFLTALREIDRAISGSLDPRLSLTLLLTHTTAELGVDAAAVWVFRAETQALERLVERGLRPRLPHLSTQRLGEGPVGRAALERRPLFLPDLNAPNAQSRLAEAALAEGFASLHVLPLIAKGEVRGVLEVYQRPPRPDAPPRPPEAEWHDFLNALAGEAAIALDNALLFTGLQRANMDLTAAFDSLLESLARALDRRGGEPEGHSRRVADLAEALARALGVAGADLNHTRRGALLHDLGKLSVPEHILFKPGPLTEDEWQVMRAAPAAARDLLSPVAVLRWAVAAPLAQHEHWDGSGYPAGLSGEQIPLMGRICAVASAWEAVQAERPSRPAFTAAQARAHLRAAAGQQFDPKVVKAFLELRA